MNVFRREWLLQESDCKLKFLHAKRRNNRIIKLLNSNQLTIKAETMRRWKIEGKSDGKYNLAENELNHKRN